MRMRYEQKNFVRELTRNIADEICDKITKGFVPAEWDGHELRVMLADKFAASASRSIVRTAPRGKRAKAYRNAVLVDNL